MSSRLSGGGNKVCSHNKVSDVRVRGRLGLLDADLWLFQGRLAEVDVEGDSEILLDLKCDKDGTVVRCLANGIL